MAARRNPQGLPLDALGIAAAGRCIGSTISAATLAGLY
jgi:hypothetical protein